jgi:outer membrane receptor protein involved in Fe transport
VRLYEHLLFLFATATPLGFKSSLLPLLINRQLTFLIFGLCLATQVVVADDPIATENSFSFQESSQVPQTSLPTDKDIAQYRSTSLIEEVIVTATRREVDVQSVPLSVHAITEEELARLGATDFADYARTVPGISFTDNGLGGEKQVIRGISSSANLPEINPTTAFYLDEVPIMGSGIGPYYNADVQSQVRVGSISIRTSPPILLVFCPRETHWNPVLQANQALHQNLV